MEVGWRWRWGGVEVGRGWGGGGVEVGWRWGGVGWRWGGVGGGRGTWTKKGRGEGGKIGPLQKFVFFFCPGEWKTKGPQRSKKQKKGANSGEESSRSIELRSIDLAVVVKNRGTPKWLALVNRNMDQNLRSPGGLILTPDLMGAGGGGRGLLRARSPSPPPRPP